MIRIDSIWLAAEPMSMRAGKAGRVCRQWPCATGGRSSRFQLGAGRSTESQLGHCMGGKSKTPEVGPAGVFMFSLSPCWAENMARS